MMSLTKSFFELTSYMKHDKEFGDFWEIIKKEFSLSKKIDVCRTFLEQYR